jgi:hypothetical protein
VGEACEHFAVCNTISYKFDGEIHPMLGNIHERHTIGVQQSKTAAHSQIHRILEHKPRVRFHSHNQPTHISDSDPITSVIRQF